MADPLQLSGLSLFSGVGMLDEAIGLALSRRGVDYRTAAFCEWESGAASTLLARMEEQSLEPCPVFCGDLRDFPAELFTGRIDILSAGYPCQPFSVAGKQRGLEDERAMGADGDGPIEQLLRIISAVGSRFVFLENVPAALEHFRGIGRRLESLGYEIAEPIILAAEDVGASHRRERVFLFAQLADVSECRWSGSRLPEPEGREHLAGTQRSSKELAECKSGGCGELRESSGGDRLVDGRDGELGNTESDEQRRNPEHAEHGKGKPVRRSGRSMEDPAWPVQREQRAGRERAGSAMQEVGDSKNGNRRAKQQPGESTGNGRDRPTGAGSELADAGRGRFSRQGERQDQQPRRRKAFSGSDQLANSGCQLREVSPSGELSATEQLGNEVPRILAPGPGDHAEWERILSVAPHLAPAIIPETRLGVSEFHQRLFSDCLETSIRRTLRTCTGGGNRAMRRRAGKRIARRICEALSRDETAQSAFRLLPDGVAPLVDASRADQLRCTGNGVVAIQGAAALELHLRAFGL